MRQTGRSVGARALLIIGLLAAVAVTRPHGTAAQMPALRWDGLVEHLTAAAAAPQPDGPSRLSRHAVTRDGRYVVFESDALNLGPWGEPSAIYRRDRMTGQTERLFGMTGSDAVVSADGHHMAVVHCAGWFRPDMATICDVYAVDLRNWSIVVASSGLDGTYSDGPSSQPVLSGDGRFVLFRTAAPNLLPAGAAPQQVMLRDRDADQDGIFDEPDAGAVTLETVSMSSDGLAANAASESAEISDNGRFVAFRSLASNLVAGDTNAHWDVFLRDRLSGETRRINVGWDGQQATPAIDSPHISMSADGRYIAFASDDSYMAPQWASIYDTNNNLDVFVYDREEDTRTRIDLGVDGGPGNGATHSPMLTEDGRHVLLVTSSTDVGEPSSAGLPVVYVHDRVSLVSQRVSYKPDWSEANAAWERPVISRDGSLIVFSSRATDLAEHVTSGIDAIYAASHFQVTPQQLTLSGHGGRVTAYITAQAFTPWQASLEQNGWLNYDSLPWGVGSGSMAFLASGANPDPTPRSVTAVINGKTVVITQGPGLTLSGISPASGPMTGGNEVTITGTGFLNGTVAFFDGVLATRTEFVNATTLRADLPAHAPGVVSLHVMSPDRRWALLPNAYRYVDTTPPQITPWVDGTLGSDGWYTSDVSVSWLVNDGDSPGSVVPGAGCAQTWLRTDSEGTTYTCTATSEGGSASQSVTIKRDTRVPWVSIATPQATLYRANQAVNASYSCVDPTPGSRLATCVGTVPSGTPIPVSTPGLHDFTITATDRAGWTSSATRRYGVAHATCQAWPQDLVAWWPGDNDYRDAVGGHTGTMINPVVQGTAFYQGIQGQAISTNSGAARYLQIGDSPDFEFTGSFTLASWFYVLGTQNPVNVIAGREGEYMLGYGPDQRLRYALQTDDHQWGWVNTGIPVNVNVYTHVAMTYDGTAVRIYVNGELAFARAATGPVGDALPDLDDFRIGARQLPSDPSYFTGHMDNVMVLSRAMSATDVESLFLSGIAGLCPKPTTVRIVPTPSVKAYGSSWVEVVAELTGPDGPIAGRSLSFFYATQFIGGGQKTDENGIARHWINVPNTQEPGTYANVIHVKHALTSDLQASEVHGDLLVTKATPPVSWNTPAAITHGTPLTSTQLNAIVGANGWYTYTPGWGTVLPAGDHTLSLLFQPSDPTRYTTATASVTINVRRATPTVTVSGGTFVYDAAPHPATGTVTGVGGVALGPLTFTYNGASTPPVDAGVYTVVAEFAGNANYEPASRTATVTITRAAPSMALTGGTFTYDGTPHAASVSLTGAGGAPLGPVAVTYNGSPDGPITPGEYAVAAEFAGNTNYQPASRSAVLTILRATPTVTVTGGSFVFDGQPHAATASATGIGGETLTPVTLTYNGSLQVPANAGSYAVSASYAGNANYAPATGTATLTISKAPSVVTVANASFTYDGQPHGVTGTVTGVDGLALGPLTFTYNGATDVPVAAGAYAVVASFPGDANHEPASGSAVLTIGKASTTVTATGGTFTFDGQPHGATAAATGAGGAALGPLTFTYNGSAEVPVAAGTYAVVANFAGDANHEPASGSAVLTIGKASATVTATGGAFTFDGQPHGASATATGAGGAALGPMTLTYNGSAEVPVAAGTYVVVASFAGDANHEPASGSAVLTIGKAAATVTVTGGTFTFDGQPHSATATATGAGGAALGPLTFTYNGAPDVPVAAGTFAVVASFAGDANHEPASGSGVVTIGKAMASVTVNGGTFTYDGQPHGANATVTGAGGAALGPLTFAYNGAPDVPVAAGTYAVVASFAGDANHEPASGSATVTIEKATVVLQWMRPAAVTYGTPLGAGQLTATANVPGTFTYTPGAGTVLAAGPARALAALFTPADPANFTGGSVETTIDVLPAPLTIRGNDAAKPFGAPLPVLTASASGFVNGDSWSALNGSLVLTTSAVAQSPVGTYPIVPSGVSSSNYAITFASGVLTIVRGSVVVAVTSSPQPSGFDQPLVVTASVTSAAPAVGNPGGTVSFFDGPVLIGTATLNAAGTASLATAGLDAGTRTLEARYNGDASFAPGMASTTHVVMTAAQTPAVTLTSSRNPSNVGQSVTLTANVSLGSGSVQFYDGATLLGTATLSSGRATLTTAALGAGSHAITARYLGDASAPPARSPVFVQTVGEGGWKNRTSSVVVSTSPSSSAPGLPVTISATVSGSSGAPTGTLLFMVNGEVVGSADVTQTSATSSVATFSLPGLPGGRHNVSATYLGSSTYKGSTAQVTHAVN